MLPRGRRARRVHPKSGGESVEPESSSRRSHAQQPGRACVCSGEKPTKTIADALKTYLPIRRLPQSPE